MARKSKPSKAGKSGPPAAEGFPRRKVTVDCGRNAEEAYRNHAIVAVSPELAASRVIRSAEHKPGADDPFDLPSLVETLRDQGSAVNRGDLSHPERMLMNQAVALENLFTRLTERALGMEMLPQFEGFMRMALRAQSQSRATLETLAAIKNPPIVYARQANVTTGPQQVNNTAIAPSRTREIESQPSRLLGTAHVERMDIGAAGAPGGNDSALATVGEINGAQDDRG